MNQQLVDYIKQQLQLGVTKEAIKATLISSGWTEGDVTEAMNEISAPAAAAPKIAPAPAVATATASPATRDIYQPKVAASAVARTEPTFQSKISAAASQISARGTAAPTGKRGLILPIILGVIILALAGAGFYFYSQTGSLSDQMSSSESKNMTLTSQLNVANQDKTNLMQQVTTLSDDKKDLLMQISFFQNPGTSTPATETAVLVKGALAGGDKLPYSITTSLQITVTIKNSKDQRVIDLLKPLLGTTVEIAGTHFIGSKDITVTAVNGNQLPAVAATSTPSSTAPSAPKAPVAPAASSTKTVVPPPPVAPPPTP